MSNASSSSPVRWTPQSVESAPSAQQESPALRAPPLTGHARSIAGMRTLTGSTHALHLAADARGATVARGEWELAFSRETEHIEAGARVVTQEHLRFRADAARLRKLALAMLAGARELDAIEAHITPVDAVSRVDFDYLETITLTEHGVGPSYDSHLVVERSD
jgi:hypothetical protein